MIDNVNKQEIILEVKELIKGIEIAKDEINIYCDLMRQIFLSSSQNN